MLKLGYTREALSSLLLHHMLIISRFDISSPIAGLKGSDNIISFYTERYGDNALIVQGAG